MDAALLHAVAKEIEHATGQSLGACQARPVGGGCIHEAYVLVALTPCFVKVNSAARAGLFDAEMDALKAIDATEAIRVPRPLVAGRHGDRSFLVLEYIAMGRGGGASSWESFGAQLASMHRHVSPDGSYGWHCANYIGATPQPNAASHDWISFWREQRLGFQLKLAAEQSVRFAGSERLLEHLPLFFEGYMPEASLLHGDLWSGNASFTEDEGGTPAPIIYDPASYYGDRECDLAFTELFGSFPAAFYEAYDDAWPRHASWSMRRDLYNLYHVLNHFHLFGGGYRSQAQEMMHALNRLV